MCSVQSMCLPAPPRRTRVPATRRKSGPDLESVFFDMCSELVCHRQWAYRSGRVQDPVPSGLCTRSGLRFSGCHGLWDAEFKFAFELEVSPQRPRPGAPGLGPVSVRLPGEPR